MMLTPPLSKSTPPKRSSIAGSYIFLLLVVVVFVVSFVFEPERTSDALSFSSEMAKKILPIMGVVIGLLFLNTLLVKPKWVRKHVGHGSGWKGWLVAVGGGIMSMGPIYVWYEVLHELQQKGMRTSLIAAFLYARSVKPQMLPLLIYYFGWLYALVLITYLIIFSVFNGMLTARLSVGAGNHVEEDGKKV